MANLDLANAINAHTQKNLFALARAGNYSEETPIFGVQLCNLEKYFTDIFGADKNLIRKCLNSYLSKSIDKSLTIIAVNNQIRISWEHSTEGLGLELRLLSQTTNLRRKLVDKIIQSDEAKVELAVARSLGLKEAKIPIEIYNLLTFDKVIFEEKHVHLIFAKHNS